MSTEGLFGISWVTFNEGMSDVRRPKSAIVNQLWRISDRENVIVCSFSTHPFTPLNVGTPSSSKLQGRKQILMRNLTRNSDVHLDLFICILSKFMVLEKK